MKICMTKRQDGSFMPTYESDLMKAKKVKVGSDVEVTIKKPRNYNFHKKFFALINLGFMNQDITEVFEDWRAIVIMKCGYYRQIETDKGVVWLPKSISFAKMDESEFSELYNKVLDLYGKMFDLNESQIENELISFY